MEYEAGDSAKGDFYLRQLLEAMYEASPDVSPWRAYPAFTIPVMTYMTGVYDHFYLARRWAEVTISAERSTPMEIQQAREGWPSCPCNCVMLKQPNNYTPGYRTRRAR